MARLIFSPLAEGDLNDILDYISRDKPKAAIRWVQKIRDTFTLLAKNPEIGERRPEFRTGEFRSSIVGRYVIYYRATENGIEIARVVRGERDIRNL
jgi:toxin ParE1/3/4